MESSGSEQVFVFLEKVPPSGDRFAVVMSKITLHPVVLDCFVYFFRVCGHPSFGVFG